MDEFPADSHLPIVYPVAITTAAHPGAARFVEFLSSAPARDTFQKSGFVTLP